MTFSLISHFTAIRIESKLTQGYEYGKSATFEWIITYSKEENNVKNIILDMYKDGKNVRVGINSVMKKDVIPKERASITIDLYKVLVTIHKLRYDDYFNFTLTAVEQNDNFQVVAKEKKQMAITEVRGKLYCSIRPVQCIFRIFV